MASAAQGSLRRIISTRKINAAKILEDAIAQLKKDVAVYRGYSKLKWVRLYRRVKPLLAVRTKELEQAEVARQMDELREKAQKSQEENKYLQENVELLKKKIVGILDEHKQEKEYFEYNLSQCEELNQGLRTAMANKDKELIEAENGKKNLQEEMVKASDAFNKKEEEVLSCREEAKKAAAELSRVKEENEEEIQRYMGLVNKAKLEMQDMEAQATQLNTEITRHKHREQEMQEEIETANADLAHSKEKYAQMKESFNKMMEESMQKADSEKTAQLEGEISLLGEKIETLNKNIKNLRAEKEELQKENLKVSEDKLEERYNAEKTLNALKAQHQTESALLKRKISDLEEEIENTDGNAGAYEEILRLKEENLKKVNELELRNYELQQKVSGIDINAMRNDLKQIKANYKNSFEVLMKRVADNTKEYNKLVMEPYKVMEQMRVKHNAQVEQYKKYFNDMFEKNLQEDGHDKMRIEQLERMVAHQERIIEGMSGVNYNKGSSKYAESDSFKDEKKKDEMFDGNDAKQ